MKSKDKKILSQKLKSYKKQNQITYFLYFLSAIFVFAFGIYFIEIWEILGGVFLFLRGAFLIRKDRVGLLSIQRNEKRKLSFILFLVLVFSLINPIGLLPLLMEIRKRDWVIKGGLDEEEK